MVLALILLVVASVALPFCTWLSCSSSCSLSCVIYTQYAKLHIPITNKSTILCLSSGNNFKFVTKLSIKCWQYGYCCVDPLNLKFVLYHTFSCLSSLMVIIALCPNTHLNVHSTRTLIKKLTTLIVHQISLINWKIGNLVVAKKKSLIWNDWTWDEWSTKSRFMPVCLGQTCKRKICTKQQAKSYQNVARWSWCIMQSQWNRNWWKI